MLLLPAICLGVMAATTAHVGVNATLYHIKPASIDDFISRNTVALSSCSKGYLNL